MSTHALTAQNSPVHLGRFDERKVHFGIQVGYTQSKFDLHYTDDDAVREDILGTTSYATPAVIKTLSIKKMPNKPPKKLLKKKPKRPHVEPLKKPYKN